MRERVSLTKRFQESGDYAEQFYHGLVGYLNQTFYLTLKETTRDRTGWIERNFLCQDDETLVRSNCQGVVVSGVFSERHNASCVDLVVTPQASKLLTDYIAKRGDKKLDEMFEGLSDWIPQWQ